LGTAHRVQKTKEIFLDFSSRDFSRYVSYNHYQIHLISLHLFSLIIYIDEHCQEMNKINFT